MLIQCLHGNKNLKKTDSLFYLKLCCFFILYHINSQKIKHSTEFKPMKNNSYCAATYVEALLLKRKNNYYMYHISNPDVSCLSKEISTGIWIHKKKLTNQVRYFLARRIKIFLVFLSLVAFSASVSHLTFRHFMLVHPSFLADFLCCVFLPSFQ